MTQTLQPYTVEPARRPSLLARIWWRLSAILIHPLDALYDHWRYLRHGTSLRRAASDRQRLESLIIFYYHKIEKALALPEVKPVFGLSYLGKTLDLLQQWAEQVGELQGVPFAAGYAAVYHYHRHVKDELCRVQPELAARLEQFLAAYAPERDTFTAGGTTTVTAVDLFPPDAWPSFASLAKSRHSVRHFSRKPIPDGEIREAVALAQRTPSVCNRQSWQVHVFSTAADKERVLQFQNGNAGFGHLADRILLLTVDLRTFVSSGERNQGFIEGGLFAMSLMYSLQARGIAACPLNLSISAPVDAALRRVSGIAAWETPIMMIGIGYAPESFRVAVSARRPTDSMLFFRDLAQEERA